MQHNSAAIFQFLIFNSQFINYHFSFFNSQFPQ